MKLAVNTDEITHLRGVLELLYIIATYATLVGVGIEIEIAGRSVYAK